MRALLLLTIALPFFSNAQLHAQDDDVAVQPPDLIGDPFLPDPTPAVAYDGSVDVEVSGLGGGISGTTVSVSASFRAETHDEPATISYYLRVREYTPGTSAGTVLTAGSIVHSNSGNWGLGKHTIATWSSSIQGQTVDSSGSYIIEARIDGSTGNLYNGLDSDYASTDGGMPQA